MGAQAGQGASLGRRINIFHPVGSTSMAHDATSSNAEDPSAAATGGCRLTLPGCRLPTAGCGRWIRPYHCSTHVARSCERRCGAYILPRCSVLQCSSRAYSMCLPARFQHEPHARYIYTPQSRRGRPLAPGFCDCLGSRVAATASEQHPRTRTCRQQSDGEKQPSAEGSPEGRGKRETEAAARNVVKTPPLLMHRLSSQRRAAAPSSTQPAAVPRSTPAIGRRHEESSALESPSLSVSPGSAAMPDRR